MFREMKYLQNVRPCFPPSLFFDGHIHFVIMFFVSFFDKYTEITTSIKYYVAVTLDVFYSNHFFKITLHKLSFSYFREISLFANK